MNFNASASADPDGTIASYAWDFDNDGQFDDASGVTASRSFATAGSHSVRLRVTDNLGASDVAASVVTVAGTPIARLNRSPVAFFTATPAVTTVGRTVQFNAAGSSDTDGTVVRYQWDLDGDGQFDDASGVAVARSFDVLGPHTVSLRVTDNDGATAVSSRPIGVCPETASASAPLALMTPFPVVRIAGRLAGRGARITRLEVRGAPRGATVTVRCRGGGCRYRQRSKPASFGRLRFRSFERRLRSGAVLRVFVTLPGKVGKYTSFKIRRRRGAGAAGSLRGVRGCKARALPFIVTGRSAAALAALASAASFGVLFAVGKLTDTSSAGGSPPSRPARSLSEAHIDPLRVAEPLPALRAPRKGKGKRAGRRSKPRNAVPRSVPTPRRRAPRATPVRSPPARPRSTPRSAPPVPAAPRLAPRVPVAPRRDSPPSGGGFDDSG